VKEAATSDMFEIQSSQLAQERGNAAEKTFAATMIEDHQKTSDDLKSMISSGDVEGGAAERPGQFPPKRNRQAEIAQWRRL
jgi:predicted outer membrane protein